MSVAYTPWSPPLRFGDATRGDVLAYYGSGGVDFGYLGGMYDDTTGLIYLGGGQYYDPVTGRMLTRGAGQSNPYKPGAFDPAGMMVAPLGLLGLVMGRKKKRGKWDSFIILLVVGVVVGMSVSACNQLSASPVPGASGTPTPLSIPTATGTATLVVTATVKPAMTGTSEPPAEELHLELFYQCLDDIKQEEPEMPIGLSSDAQLAWDTYIKLWNKTEIRHKGEWRTPWWWFEGFNKTASFTPLDFLDRLIQFELEGIVSAEFTDDIERETYATIGVGNFCFWTTRVTDSTGGWYSGGDCRNTIKDKKEIFEYIAKRELLVNDASLKNYSIPGDNFVSWEAVEHSTRAGYELPIVESFLYPKEEWLDWRSDKSSIAADDVPVEWGNHIEDHYDATYNGIQERAKKYPGGKGAVIGHQTNEVFHINGTFHVFTFCQLVYYENGVAKDSNCGNSYHLPEEFQRE